MLTPQDIARQLEMHNADSIRILQNEDHESVPASDADALRRRIGDPNVIGGIAEIDELLRLPNVLEAIGLLTKSTRGFLKGLTRHEPEFENVFNAIMRAEDQGN